MYLLLGGNWTLVEFLVWVFIFFEDFTLELVWVVAFFVDFTLDFCYD